MQVRPQFAGLDLELKRLSRRTCNRPAALSRSYRRRGRTGCLGYHVEHACQYRSSASFASLCDGARPETPESPPVSNQKCCLGRCLRPSEGLGRAKSPTNCASSLRTRSDSGFRDWLISGAAALFPSDCSYCVPWKGGEQSWQS